MVAIEFALLKAFIRSNQRHRYGDDDDVETPLGLSNARGLGLDDFATSSHDPSALRCRDSLH